MSATTSAMPANGIRDDERDRCADCGAILDGVRIEITPVQAPFWRLVLCSTCALVAIECDEIGPHGLGRRVAPAPPALAGWWAAA